VTDVTAGDRVEAELVVTGMTCGACAARIERRLNRLDGVSATVNYATGRAYFTRLGGRDTPELISVINSTGYRAALPAPPREQDEADPAARKLGLRLAFCAPLAVIVIVLAMVPAAQFTGWQWASLVFAAPVAAWGAWPMHRSALAGLRHSAATMDTLVSLAVAASFCWSLYALLFGGAGRAGMRMPFAFTFSAVNGQTLYLEAAAGVATAVIAGRYLEARAKHRAASALTALAALGVKSVAVLRDGAEHRVAAAELAAGDLFVVRPGERIAADGVVASGSSAVDTSLVTGESMPVEVGEGDQVTGATVNMSGHLVVRATRVGADTLLAQITRLVTQAQATKASAQRLADRIAAVFVPCVISLAVVTLGFWLGTGLPAAQAWSAAVAVLVVACPCALGLATPAALVAAVGRGAELGVLAKSARALEAARRIRVVVLDKTGTLTAGSMALTAVVGAPGSAADEALLLAGAVEDASEHPVGQSIARAATARFGGLPAVTGFTALPGSGVRGRVGGRDVVVGSRALLAELSCGIPAELDAAVRAAAGDGQTAVLVGWDGQARAALAVADRLRPTAAAAVARLRDLGLRPMMLTGDNERAALAIAGQVGIDAADVFAGVRPEGKAEVIRRLQAAGQPAAFVGDGVNDAAALAQADLGLALGTGADAAIGAADITLVSGDPASAADAISLARAAMTVIRGNLAWAFGYNVIALPLAALGYLNPLFAGVAMSASSLIVVANSLRLRGFTPRGRHAATTAANTLRLRGSHQGERKAATAAASILRWRGFSLRGRRPVTAEANSLRCRGSHQRGRHAARRAVRERFPAPYRPARPVIAGRRPTAAETARRRPAGLTWPAGLARPGNLARAAAGPVICAVALTGLLSAWLAGGGAGTLTRVRLQVTLAAVPMRAVTPALADSIRTAGTFLTISNPGGSADELVAVRSPLARDVSLVTRDGLGGRQTAVGDLTVPAHGTLTLSPVADDAVLQDPVAFEGRPTVPLTLVFRDAGPITINAPVTVPGTP
jgi:P-type Cu+ transporter